MKKLLGLSFILFYTSSFFSQSSSEPGYVSGNVQAIGQYYQEDTLINAALPNHLYGFNGFTNINFQKGDFRAGIRYETYLNTLEGYPTSFSGTGIGYRYLTWNKDNVEVTVGSFYDQLGSGMILRAYEEAETYLEDRFFLSDTYIFSGDTSYLSNEDYSWQDNYLLQAVQKDIQFKDIYSLKHDINKFFEKYQNSPALSHIYIRFICCNLLQLLYEELPESRKADFSHKVASIYSTQKLQEIRVLIDNVLDEVIKKLEMEQQSPNHAINVVKQYIYEHYNENLSLELLADKVFLSYRYLSSLFIQETGCGINKYIKNIRMDKAKDLLFNTNMKVADICKAVGYSNVSYFCKSFKDNFGVTPEKYREIHP